MKTITTPAGGNREEFQAMKPPTYRWQLSPSKFEAAKGCPCFEEEDRMSQKDKERGTNLHEYMEYPDRKLDNLSPDEREAVQFCRDFDTKLDNSYGPFVFEARELYVPKTDLSPGGKLDRCAVSESGTLIVVDYKFGQMPVPPVLDNPQVRAYALMAWERLKDQCSIKDTILGVIVQPAQNLEDLAEFTLGDLSVIEAELKQANDRVADPFKQPDPSDTNKCQRCKHAARCPAVSGAVTKFVEQTQLLPMPEQFAPGSIVSERDRILAQQLAVILETWADRIKQSNREYAEQNGGTLGGVYNLTTRANGFEITDVPGLTNALVELKLLEKPEDILQLVKVTKSKLVEGLTGLTTESASEVKATIAELEERFGAPRPPVTVFRAGGKRQIAKPMEDLGVPMLENPFKQKD